MAQFGGQKNPPWATQFAATAVSQPGHSGQSLDLSSLHCEYSKADILGFLIIGDTITEIFNVLLFYIDSLTLTHVITPWWNILFYINTPHSMFSSAPLNLVPYFPSLQLLVCSSRLFWEHLLLFTLSSQPWLQSLSATSLLQTISCLSKLLPCSSKLQQLLLQHYSRSVTVR